MACYLLRAGETERVKIGYAANVEERLSTLQAAHWERLIILRTWEGDRIAEGWLHHQFPEQRIDRDWFVFHPGMMQVEIPDLSDSRPQAATNPDPILRDIEMFLVRHAITPTAFGKMALADPLLVRDIRRGRELRRKTRARIQEFIKTFADAVQPHHAEASV